MDTSKLTTMMYLKTWLLFIVGSVVGGALGGGGIGFFVGFAYGLVCNMTHSRPDLALLTIICSVVGFVVGVPISFLFFRWSIDRMLKKAFPAN